MRLAFAVLLCGAMVFLSSSFVGCGALFNGSTKTVSVQASPTGTKLVTNPPTGDFVAPTTLELERKSSYMLTFSKEGYNSTSVQIKKKAQFGIIFLDVFFTGLIGVVVDAATGSWNNLSPDQVSVSLEKLESGSIEEPDIIEITLSSKKTSADEDALTIQSSEPVGVSVEVLR